MYVRSELTLLALRVALSTVCLAAGCAEQPSADSEQPRPVKTLVIAPLGDEDDRRVAKASQRLSEAEDAGGPQHQCGPERDDRHRQPVPDEYHDDGGQHEEGDGDVAHGSVRRCGDSNSLRLGLD